MNWVVVTVIAAFFQKDPAVLISHKSSNFDKIEDLKLSKVMISPDTRIGFWRFLSLLFTEFDLNFVIYNFEDY